MGPTGADLIIQARKTAGLTQRELAERAGTTQSSIARWEAGATEPSFATVVRLLRLCGYVLDVHLEPYDDGLRDDWHQAQQRLSLSLEERLDAAVELVQIARDLRAGSKAPDVA